jgi:hypothetical protein
LVEVNNMRNIRRSAGVSGLLVLASIVVFAGCNSPTAVEPTHQDPVFSTQEAPCPTVYQICTSIVDEIERVCPVEYPYKSWGDENSCHKTLLGRELDSYKDCLTGNQFNDVRDCVYEKLGIVSTGNIGKGPVPHEQSR